jgi:DNA-binding transcriptional LysR family regulator
VTRVLCYQIDLAERGGQLQRVLRDFEPPPLPISLVHAGQRRLPLKLRAFLDFATPRLRERMGR